MSELTGCKQSADSASRKRCPSPGRDEGSAIPAKSTKVTDAPDEAEVTSESCRNSEAESKEIAGSEGQSKDSEGKAAAVRADRGSDRTDGASALPVRTSGVDGADASSAEKPQSSRAHGSADAKEDAAKTAAGIKPLPSASLDQTDSAAIAAAEALASLTGGDGEDSRETPCSSEKVKQVKPGSKFKQRGSHHSHSRTGSKTQAAAADSSTSVHSTDREDADEMPEADEGDESISGSTSTPSSSFPSDNDDGECAIVSVKMAPEMRQSVALLAQVQMRLEAFEKKSARLHQRLELKISRQRRPHLDQRSSITKTIPGFWVTAVSLT
ncbi:Testis-specific Y-encoded-like protein 1 [Liparis tanakae]|uniref:Testis-specific Y-encoded-like protein 1 n=1 Tax=Liparis tanakae TaxID=230148 RepID=A0A4Z2ICJ8_9TELE|nr:Testis-specific Y-encoded-like protein 1 [Liparis tanakae]